MSLRNRTVRVATLAVLALGAVPAGADDPAGPDGNGPDRPLRIVCFGDSITGHRPQQPYQGQYLKYADLLELLLEGRLGLGRAEVVNSGWAGDATYPRPEQGMPGALGRLEKDLLDLQPDIAVMLIGGNDRIDTPEQTARTRENLRQIARRIDQAGIRLLVCQYAPALPDPNAPEKAWTHIDDKNPLIAQAARAVDAPLLDFGPPLRQAAQRYPRTDLVNAVDGIHLQPRGEIVYARAIFAKLEELGWIPAPARQGR